MCVKPIWLRKAVLVFVSVGLIELQEMVKMPSNAFRAMVRVQKVSASLLFVFGFSYHYRLLYRLH